MLEQILKKENNLLQSEDWAKFQEALGRKSVNLAGSFGFEAPIMFGKSFVWIEKGPKKISNFKFPITNIDPKVIFVRLEPGIVTESDVKKYKLKKVGKKSLLSGQKSPKATLALDLNQSEEELLSGMKSKTRYNVRLAAKKGVTVRVSSNPADANILFELLKSTEKRNKGYSTHESDYYLKMMESLAPKGILKIYIAEYESKPLAAILVSQFGEVATYLHGGFTDVHKELMAPYLCQWEAIKEAKKAGAKVYDFWGVAETDDPSDPWAGITRFKVGFGGEKIIFPGAYDYVINKFWYNMLSFAANLRRIIR